MGIQRRYKGVEGIMGIGVHASTGHGSLKDG